MSLPLILRVSPLHTGIRMSNPSDPVHGQQVKAVEKLLEEVTVPTTLLHSPSIVVCKTSRRSLLSSQHADDTCSAVFCLMKAQNNQSNIGFKRIAQ